MATLLSIKNLYYFIEFSKDEIQQFLKTVGDVIPMLKYVSTVSINDKIIVRLPWNRKGA